MKVMSSEVMMEITISGFGTEEEAREEALKLVPQLVRGSWEEQEGCDHGTFLPTGEEDWHFQFIYDPEDVGEKAEREGKDR